MNDQTSNMRNLIGLPRGMFRVTGAEVGVGSALTLLPLYFHFTVLTYCTYCTSTVLLSYNDPRILNKKFIRFSGYLKVVGAEIVSLRVLNW